MNVENAVAPTPEQIRELTEGGHDQPIYMVNLLKFKEKAEYEDGRETELSGQEAYGIYGMEVAGHLAKVGGKPVIGGRVIGPGLRARGTAQAPLRESSKPSDEREAGLSPGSSALDPGFAREFATERVRTRRRVQHRPVRAERRAVASCGSRIVLALP